MPARTGKTGAAAWLLSAMCTWSVLGTLLSPRVAHAKSDGEPPKRNVLGGPLQACCSQPPVGYFRDGYCRTDASDAGLHVVCAIVTDEFLAFTREQGNDLSTPRPHFAGLKAGDRWCLCASRWQEAFEANKAPLVDLAATDEAALRVVSLKSLQEKAKAP